MKKLILIAGLLLVVGCSKEPNTKLLCECISTNCHGIDMSVVVNESNKSFIVDFGDLTNIDFTEAGISGEYPTDNKNMWHYRLDRVDLTLTKYYWPDDNKPKSVEILEHWSNYQCKIVDGI